MRVVGNHKLKAARVAHGLVSQEALAAALNEAAGDLGLHGVSIGARQVRRWESSEPPWPQPHHQRLLTHVLGLRIEDLGFVAPWGGADERHAEPPAVAASPLRRPSLVPDTAADDLATVTVAHRRLYWSIDPVALHPAVTEHVRLGAPLLSGAMPGARRRLGAALGESALLAGRIEFFDLRRPETAAETFVRAMQLAGEAGDELLGAAVVTHAAFVPGWSGDLPGAVERVAAGRAYARRASAPAPVLAWIDAVEAECMTRCGDAKGALGVIDRAEAALRADAAAAPPPAWFDWFTPVRLAAFKGNTQLAAGQLRRARDTLAGVLDELPATDVKQRSVVAADLAAVEVAAEDPVGACARLGEALDALGEVWYATGMERVRAVRRSLRPWQHQDEVRDLDDRLYGWETSVNALAYPPR
ncbi:MAG: hypothetical protein AVDCRST_MAG66-201 [uncultured Pseudonocardia sp.]|uniref:Transcriptional regulator n=1 Tax=uncultured Pseudonocardia sp. TaxID=211455 RepID=A0A6J4N9L3_9PSEU|nr:MAG: hypothetical protein AVDCRST_MAG66-201 [uncultured Pseudonocardia sp.]